MYNTCVYYEVDLSYIVSKYHVYHIGLDIALD